MARTGLAALLTAAVWGGLATAAAAPGAEAGAAKPVEIAEVHTMLQLAEAKPLVVNGWEVRLGLGKADEAAPTWRVLYCRGTWIGRGQPEMRGEGAREADVEDVGPVRWRLRSAQEDKREQDVLLSKADWRVIAPREAIWCAVVPVAWRGKFKLQVLDGKDRVIAERLLNVKRAPAHCWWDFAEIKKTDDGDEDGARCIVSAHPDPAWPTFDEWAPAVSMANVRDLEGETPLPATPTPAACWLRHFLGKKPPAAGVLRLSLEGRTLVVRSAMPVPLDAEHLLARWWVNGKPVIVRDVDGAVDELAKAERAGGPDDMKVDLRLPAILGKLKPGDRVGLQLLLSPGEKKRFYYPGGVERLLKLEALRARASQFMLLSNRIDFPVTEDMLGNRPR